MHQPFRFIHASDLHLERLPAGLAEVPDQLRSAIIDAPHRAAERVFDAAIKERVDFLLLAGDVIDPLAAGPRGLHFLQNQFARLAGQGITTYWAGGRGDDFERWLDGWTPGGWVHRFPLHRVERIVHRRGDEPIAVILGTSTQERRRIRAGEFRSEGGELYSIALAYGTADAEALAQQSMGYWALGGQHRRRTLLSGPMTAHYCGTPQGRKPSESGPCGCTLVHVDENQRARASFIATDAIRYLQETFEVTEPTTPEQLAQMLGERMQELLADPFGPTLLVDWTITGSEAIAEQLRRGKLAGDLAARLRADFVQHRPAAWTLGVSAAPDSVPAGLLDEETVLGEFLRAVELYRQHPEQELSLENYLAPRHVAGSLGADVALDDPAVRERVLADAARLGIELLSPQEAPR